MARLLTRLRSYTSRVAQFEIRSTRAACTRVAARDGVHRSTDVAPFRQRCAALISPTRLQRYPRRSARMNILSTET
jgi:hypothetical protein